MWVVGLTGGIGSGKTQASNWFAKQGVTVVDADILARSVVAQGSATLAKIVAKFGDWVLDEAGNMNRRAIREYVFARPQALMDLEQITHPAIREAAKAELAQADSPYAVLVAPLLLEASEAGLASLCQRILVIDCDEAEQLARASLRDGQSQEHIQRIMANQLPRAERLSQADDVIENNGTLEELYQKLAALHQQYLDLARS